MHKSTASRVAVLAAALALLLGACGAPAQPAAEQGALAISGAFALYPMMARWAEEYQKVHPEVSFDLSAGGAGKGMADALAGAVDIGMVSREISAEEVAAGAFAVAVTRDAVFAVANASNPAAQELLRRGLTRQEFAGIYLSGSLTAWGQVSGAEGEIHLYTRSDACGAAETWAKFLGGRQEDLRGIGVFGDPGLLDAVAKDPLGLGYNNLGYVFAAENGALVEGVVVLPIDANENGQADADELLQTRAEAVEAVASGVYPSPPARLLYLVTHDKPQGLAQAFIQWILTEGQAYVDEVGYVRLSQAQLDEEAARLK
ncbi:MAG: substrate-binding domain-containing protein [Chloroflexi bacterium]|nr:substrate-binding domain-containing protein [Chloroflexota bacterium]